MECEHRDWPWHIMKHVVGDRACLTASCGLVDESGLFEVRTIELNIERHFLLRCQNKDS